VIYPLDEVLLLCLLAVLAGAESFVEIARFGTKKLDLLRRFRTFADRRMINSATSSPRSTPRNSSGASSPGWRR
jgi:DDE_Tnp_1-associated